MASKWQSSTPWGDGWLIGMAHSGTLGPQQKVLGSSNWCQAVLGFFFFFFFGREPQGWLSLIIIIIIIIIYFKKESLGKVLHFFK
jgi:hypothetical protein